MNREEKNFILERAQAAVQCYENKHEDCESCIYKGKPYCNDFKNVDEDAIICVIADLLDVIYIYEDDINWLKAHIMNYVDSIVSIFNHLEFNEE